MTVAPLRPLPERLREIHERLETATPGPWAQIRGWPEFVSTADLAQM
jgi:hypothetical protein